MKEKVKNVIALSILTLLFLAALSAVSVVSHASLYMIGDSALYGQSELLWRLAIGTVTLIIIAALLCFFYTGGGTRLRDRLDKRRRVSRR